VMLFSHAGRSVAVSPAAMLVSRLRRTAEPPERFVTRNSLSLRQLDGSTMTNGCLARGGSRTPWGLKHDYPIVASAYAARRLVAAAGEPPSGAFGFRPRRPLSCSMVSARSSDRPCNRSPPEAVAGTEHGLDAPATA